MPEGPRSTAAQQRPLGRGQASGPSMSHFSCQARLLVGFRMATVPSLRAPTAQAFARCSADTQAARPARLEVGRLDRTPELGTQIGPVMLSLGSACAKAAVVPILLPCPQRPACPHGVRAGSETRALCGQAGAQDKARLPPPTNRFSLILILRSVSSLMAKFFSKQWAVCPAPGVIPEKLPTNTAGAPATGPAPPLSRGYFLQHEVRGPGGHWGGWAVASCQATT